MSDIDKVASAIWDASRADEGTISAIGAKHVAKAAIAALSHEAFVEFVRDQQVSDFSDLLPALRRAIRGPMSMEVEWIIDNIRRSAALVGPAPWAELSWHIVRTGAYAAIFDFGDLERPAPLTEEEYRETDELMVRHFNAADNQLCLALCAELAKRNHEAKTPRDHGDA